MLEEGLIEYILDGQTFDLEGVRSMREDPRHVNTSPFTSYNWHGKGNFASMVDVAVLGATEVDLELQRQRGHPLRRPPAARHRRLAELPVRPLHHPAGPVASATASRSSSTR